MVQVSIVIPTYGRPDNLKQLLALLEKQTFTDFEVIVIDHHEVLNDVPEASLVVDPKQKGDNYPSKELANTGIVFNLSQVLLKDKLKGLIKNNFLELTALATLADMMPQTGENKVLTDEGLSVLPETLRPGLKVFLKLEGIKKPSLRLDACSNEYLDGVFDAFWEDVSSKKAPNFSQQSESTYIPVSQRNR